MTELQRAIDWMEIEKESAQNSWERAGAEWRIEPGTQEMHDEQMAAFDLAIQALCQMRTEQVTNVIQDSLQDGRVAMMLTEKQIDQTMAELHDGIRSLDIWDALWLMGVQAKQAIDLAAENERLKAKLNEIRAECKRKQYGFAEYILKIIDKDGDDT